MRHLQARLLAALAAGLVASPTLADPPSPPSPSPIVQPLPPGAKVQPVALTRVGARLRDEQVVGSIRIDDFCVAPSDVAWGEVAPQFTGLQDIFAEELLRAGFKSDKDPSNLFADREGAASDLQVGAMVKDAHVSGCDGMFQQSATMTLDMEWQVYSTLRREVVARVETHEGAQRSRRMGQKIDKRWSVAQLAFAANVRALLGDATFRRVVTQGPEVDAGQPQSGGASLSPIILKSTRKAPVKIPDAVGSVVAVFVGDSLGSGVLVSADGHILTNHHVVGSGEVVRVRWSDGFETKGQVIRSDKRRDVALIKTDPHGRSPLPRQCAIPAAGTPVYAIGTPLDPGLQSTVTRGVVSAARIVGGFSFIQSDVAVTHGDSGGPLLNERGEVLGLTDWGLPVEEGSSLNFFIPIGDALDFLSLRPSS